MSQTCVQKSQYSCLSISSALLTRLLSFPDPGEIHPEQGQALENQG